MINCLCDVLRIVWKACWIIVDVVSWLSCCELCNVMKMVISSLFVWTCHLHCSETWLWQVLCALRKNKKIKRMYHFEGRVAHRDGYYISRDVSRAAMVTIIEGRIARRDGCMDRYVPHGSRTERQRVCIIRSDMHHYTWHCISLHCTSLLLVNLILCVADLVSAFLWNLWLMNIELVVEDMQLLECCCWGYETIVVVEDMKLLECCVELCAL